jgi:hypothetical protein
MRRMARPEQIRDAELRAAVERAHEAVRRGDGSAAVRKCAEAYLQLLRAKPALMEEMVEPLPGFTMPAVMRWPALGANLSLESVLERSPRIDFARERFAVSEAITYYEYLLETAIRAEA